MSSELTYGTLNFMNIHKININSLHLSSAVRCSEARLRLQDNHSGEAPKTIVKTMKTGPPEGKTARGRTIGSC